MLTNTGTVTPVVRVVGAPVSATLNAVPLTPVAASSSSTTSPWVATNAYAQDGKWWMSSVNSNSPEWIMYDFAAPVYIASVYAHCGLGRHGGGNLIQASTNGTNWVTIHAFVADNWTYQSTGQTYVSIITPPGAFRYVRLYSAPSPYCLYDRIQYTGVK